MELDECLKKIDKYLASDDSAPRLVNVQNIQDLSVLAQHFSVGNNVFIPISTYAKKDENPKIDDLQSDLFSKKGNFFVTGLTTQLKLEGEHALTQVLQNLVSHSFVGHMVFLCYQCENYLRFPDHRASRLVYMVDGAPSTLPDIVFILPELPTPTGLTSVDGVQDIARVIESSIIEKLYVKTYKHKHSYPDSLYCIVEERKAFDALCNLDATTSNLGVNYGTDEQWIYALVEMNKTGSWGALFTREFGITANLDFLVNNWKNFDNKKKWLYFIALKMNNTSGSWCLNETVKSADNIDELTRCAYRSILPLNPTESDFWIKYMDRKNLLMALGHSDDELLDYLKMVKSKESNALYFLTDSSRLEKETIFELLDKYALRFERKEVETILSHIYPDLYAYLQPYQFKNNLLDTYFQEYKYQKVINKIFPEFVVTVEGQAKKREYNRVLPPRSERIENLNKSGARLYFVDAMGVEYLGFILEKCIDKKLMADVTICRCELPSITRFNKEFLDDFDNIAPDIKLLDNIKHHGEESFDYRQTKLPVHLIRELEIIDSVLTDIKKNLIDGSIERAYIISDHGASRLAVIRENECQWKMASKGEHSGRCCPVDEADVQSEYATESNDFWVLANYDRFKGGRKANVEVHGGATLEEITIPIIELTYISEDIEVSVNSPLPIEVSFRKKAAIKLFSKNRLAGVTIRINGQNIHNKFYDAETQDNNVFTIQMSEVKQAGTYYIDVFSNNNLVASGLEFTVQKEGSKEIDLL